MKPYLFFLLLMSCSIVMQAQPDTIQLSTNKTSSLVFNRLISHADRGSRDILLQKAKGVENILLLKAARDSFPETSLSVITTDGRVRTFILHYSAAPAQLQYNADSTESVFARIAALPVFMRRPRQEKFAMSLRLTGLYIENNIIYYQLRMDNQSPINYDIQSLRFFIRDRHPSRRTAFQEIEQIPLLVYDNTPSVTAGEQHTLVIALPKFTIPDKKIFYIHLMEKNGGRQLLIKIHNRQLRRCRPL